jgi:hypothetical protein
MQELDSSQNDTEFQWKSPNWAGGHSRRPESAIHASAGVTNSLTQHTTVFSGPFPVVQTGEQAANQSAIAPVHRNGRSRCDGQALRVYSTRYSVTVQLGGRRAGLLDTHSTVPYTVHCTLGRPQLCRALPQESRAVLDTHTPL